MTIVKKHRPKAAKITDNDAHAAKSIIITLLLITLAPAAMLAQEKEATTPAGQPVVVEKASVGHGTPGLLGALIDEPGSASPGGPGVGGMMRTTLRVKVKNVSAKTITAIRFAAFTRNRFGETTVVANDGRFANGQTSPPWAFDMLRNKGLKPGKEHDTYWDAYVGPARTRPVLAVAVVQVMFEDGSSWTNPEAPKQ